MLQALTDQIEVAKASEEALSVQHFRSCTYISLIHGFSHHFGLRLLVDILTTQVPQDDVSISTWMSSCQHKSVGCYHAQHCCFVTT